MKEELKQFDIDLDKIKENNDLFSNINEAIKKLKLHTLSDRFEVVLNNNLIESKEKLTNYRTIMGCRISYDDLDKNISFIVREDVKPSYDELENKIDKAIKYIKSHNPSDIGICENEAKYYYTLDEDSVDNLLEILEGKDE